MRLARRGGGRQEIRKADHVEGDDEGLGHLREADAFNGKRVKVEGPIVDVCSEKGCWIAIGSDKEFQTIRFKVDDGVIVFPMTLKGSNAVVEGVVTVTR